MTGHYPYLAIVTLVASTVLSGCGGGGDIKEICEGPRPYQAVRETKRVVVPDDLDSLEEFKEMPLPRAASSTPVIAEGKCLESTPPILSGSTKDEGSSDE